MNQNSAVRAGKHEFSRPYLIFSAPLPYYQRALVLLLNHSCIIISPPLPYYNKRGVGVQASVSVSAVSSGFTSTASSGLACDCSKTLRHRLIFMAFTSSTSP